MTEWTKEERYQRIEEVDSDKLLNLKQQVQLSPYRQTFHIQPETGLLNDPNGLIYFNGKYYVSHQWFPLGAVHGLKYWFNYTSDDLVHFEPQGVILSQIPNLIVMVFIVEVLLNFKVIYIICTLEITVIIIGKDIHHK